MALFLIWRFSTIYWCIYQTKSSTSQNQFRAYTIMEKVAPNSKFVCHSTNIIGQSKIKGPLIHFHFQNTVVEAQRQLAPALNCRPAISAKEAIQRRTQQYCSRIHSINQIAQAFLAKANSTSKSTFIIEIQGITVSENKSHHHSTLRVHDTE